MLRVRVSSTGWAGGPGLNTFYFNDITEDSNSASNCVARVHDALSSCTGIFPTQIEHVVIPDVDKLDPINGEIVATFSVSPLAPIVGGSLSTDMLPPATAVLVKLGTNVFVEGRRIRGRAFFSPLASNNSSGLGVPTTLVAPNVDAFGAAMLNKGVTTPDLVVWQRPRAADPLHKPKPVTARDGHTAVVTAFSTPAKFSVLRSRRD